MTDKKLTPEVLKNAESISATKGKKIKVTPKKSETEKTFDLFGALFSQQRPPINFTVIKVMCVCGQPLTLHLNKPNISHIAWTAYCKDCRRRIQFAITEGPL